MNKDQRIVITKAQRKSKMYSVWFEIWEAGEWFSVDSMDATSINTLPHVISILEYRNKPEKE